MLVRPQNKGKKIIICGSTLKPPQFQVCLLFTVLVGWYHCMNLNRSKKAELNPKVLVSELGWAVSPESRACPVLQSVGASLSQGRGARSQALELRRQHHPGSTATLGSLRIPTAIIPFIALMKALIASCFQGLFF